MGICLNVPAFPMPVKKNMMSMAAKNQLNSFGSDGLRNNAAIAVKTVMPTPEMNVQIAPPNLSHNGPQAARTSAEISGPKNA